MDGVVCATTVWIGWLLFGMEGRWKGSFACACADIMFLPSLSLSSPGVAGTTIPSLASVKTYILFTLLFMLYTHPSSSSQSLPQRTIQHSKTQHNTAQ